MTGVQTGARMSRPSDERLYSSGSRDTFGYTQCYASLGSPDGADIAFAKCDENGAFTLTGIPAGDWRLTVFDQWNDQIVDGITTPVRVGSGTNQSLCHGPGSSGSTCDMGEIGVHGWKNNLSTRTCVDVGNGTPGSAPDGVCQDSELGLPLVPTNVRYRDGSISNLNSTDLQGFAGFNEVFPIFNWYVVETDSNRYKNTGTHVINDAGGPTDGSSKCGQQGFPPCGNSALLPFMTNAANYGGGNSSFRANSGADPTVVHQYCNGSKIPPEVGAGAWYQVPPGTNESNAPVPIFNLTAGATVDEGNNWISITWGPLALTHPATGAILGDYSLLGGSPAIGYITPGNSSTTYGLAPSDDYFGNPRKTNNAVDAGAVEFTGSAGPAVASITGGPLSFGNVTIGSTSAAQTLTLSNSGGSNLTGITLAFSSPRFTRPGGAAGGTCTGTLAPLSSCTINVVFSPNAAGAASGNLTVTANVPVANSPVPLSGNGIRLSVSPTSLTFITLGGAAQTQNVTVRNNAPAGGGSTGPLTVGISGVTGGVSLTVSGNNCPAGGLAPGASCTVTVRFQASGFLHSGTGTLNVSDTEPASGTVSLSGINVL